MAGPATGPGRARTVPAILDTGVRTARNVDRYAIGPGSRSELRAVLAPRRVGGGSVAFLVDEHFRDVGVPDGIDAVEPTDVVLHVDTTQEPTTDAADALTAQVRDALGAAPVAIVGIGGGSTLDLAKAVSNLLTNGGHARDYQGWDLVREPGVYKVGVPTLSGTGAEASRTCVLIEPTTGLKLGMNSDHTVFDHLLMDPDLTATVPRDQYFHSGMDAYMHSVESLAGSYRNAIGDALAQRSLDLCRKVFLAPDMADDDARLDLMVASYLGGCAIATSYVGVIHPFSAGLSVVLGLHHCVANCVAIRALGDYYPAALEEFERMREAQDVHVPSGVCQGLSDEDFDRLYRATIVHEKPLTNALGEDFRDQLTPDRVRELFERM
jgi:3-deoxy-alpha-D-manno-octulosonate 8-oxidase